MLLRRAILAALVAAPLVFSPSDASAQTGLDQAALVTVTAVDVGAAQNSQAPEELPEGIVKRFGEETLPPGMRWTRSDAVAASSDDVEDDGDDGDGGDTELTCVRWEYVQEGWVITQVCVEWGTL